MFVFEKPIFPTESIVRKSSISDDVKDRSSGLEYFDGSESARSWKRLDVVICKTCKDKILDV